MSSRIKNEENLFYLTTRRNYGINKNNRIKNLLPVKPYFLKGSNISKILNTISYNKTCKNNGNSFFIDENKKINKNKVKLLHIKKNDSKEVNERNNNKENINLNFEKEFRTLNNDKSYRHKYKKIKLNDKIQIDKGNINSNNKKYNYNKPKNINEIIIQFSNTTTKKGINKDSIKSKISELFKLKKLIFENNKFSNFQFFKRLRKFNNSIDISNSITKRNTINYFHKLIKHKKMTTSDINDKCITERPKLIDYLNVKFKNKLKESTMNSKFNSSNNDFNNSNSLINENNKTQYISNEERKNKRSINNQIKLYQQKVRKAKIFDKRKLIEKLAQSQMISKNKSEEKKYLKFNITPSIIKQKFITKINKINITKKVIKIVSCSIVGFSPQEKTPKINQSSYYVKKGFLNLKDHFLLTISNGFGPNGQLISKFICNILPKKINNISFENIIQGFSLTKKLLLKKSKINLSHNGASVSSIIITPEKIISSNIGACKGVLAINNNDRYTSINLTKIIKSDLGGIEGLDFPFIQNRIFKGNEKFILLATNGFWEFIDNDECVNIVKNFYENNLDANGALESIVRLAITRWKKEKNFVDDITAILLFFD